MQIISILFNNLFVLIEGRFAILRYCVGIVNGQSLVFFQFMIVVVLDFLAIDFKVKRNTTLWEVLDHRNMLYLWLILLLLLQELLEKFIIFAAWSLVAKMWKLLFLALRRIRLIYRKHLPRALNVKLRAIGLWILLRPHEWLVIFWGSKRMNIFTFSRIYLRLWDRTLIRFFGVLHFVWIHLR